MDFATIFNNRRHPHNKQHLSTFMSTSDRFSIDKSTHPITLHNFFITAKQSELAPPRNAAVDAQVYVFEEYATTMALWNK